MRQQQYQKKMTPADHGIVNGNMACSVFDTETSNSCGAAVSMMDKYGRFGNILTATYKMINYAEETKCSISLLPDILPGWSPPHGSTSACFVPSDYGTIIGNGSTCTKQSGHDWYYRITNLDSFSCACMYRLLRPYFAVNKTHALGRSCSAEPSAVLHVRSGDIVRGGYTKNGAYQPGNVHGGMSPHPTSYYTAVVKDIVTRNQGTDGPLKHIYILCEDLGNPTCEYFQKTADLLQQEVNFTFRFNQKLVDDLHILLCASEVAVSRGTFQEVLQLSQKLRIKHDFKNEPTNCSATISGETQEKMYWIADPQQRNQFRSDNGYWNNTGYNGYWNNTGWQRHDMNSYFRMVSCE